MSIDWQLEEGSTATPWTPFANLCPITEWTEAKVFIKAENLLPSSLPSNVIKGSFESGYSSINSASNARTFAIPVPKNTNIYVQKKNGDTTSGALALGDTGNIEVGTPIFSAVGFNNSNGQAFNTGDHGWLYIKSDSLEDTEAWFTTRELMVSVGSSRVNYVAPNNGTTREITWQTEAGTVYGCTLTINQDGSVDLKKTVTIVTLNGSQTQNNGKFDGTYNAVARWNLSDQAKAFEAGTIPNALCDKLKAIGSGLIGDFASWANNESYGYSFTIASNGERVGIAIPKSEGITSGAQLNTWLSNNNVTIAYELAIPVTYHLNSIEQLYTLLGVNNIFSDAGDVDVEYVADTKLYIDNKIAEMIASALSA